MSNDPDAWRFDDEPECEHRTVEVDLWGDPPVATCRACGEYWFASDLEIKTEQRRQRAEWWAWQRERWLGWALRPYRRFKDWRAARALKKSLDEEIPF